MYRFAHHSDLIKTEFVFCELVLYILRTNVPCSARTPAVPFTLQPRSMSTSASSHTRRDTAASLRKRRVTTGVHWKLIACTTPSEWRLGIAPCELCGWIAGRNKHASLPHTVHSLRAFMFQLHYIATGERRSTWKRKGTFFLLSLTYYRCRRFVVCRLRTTPKRRRPLDHHNIYSKRFLCQKEQQTRKRGTDQ